ncbi:DNA cytosine methyltransferase [Pelagimonas varians]|uniref:DNA (cytosine-5-)-methyltransferase n=1 Tax=Pelagimonas varians TaxID=696760 RepID=A0A238KYM1_9RHOB|nr:DNA cytosine methyltransferase [Pelagimonas varians]PYG27831.1 DNA (cytosine-5)-methyltransferase 1 [Pelagimonas varians]SMX47671.1 Modification methylase AplI [Pelagimonas varians]
MAVHPPIQPKDLCGISLCAGVKGLDLGLHIAQPGYRTVCYVERNSFAASTLVARMADASLDQAPVWDDLKTFDGKPWRGRVHLISAGYPCQPFTLSGLRKGEGDPRHLWPDVARIAREVAPEWLFFENVPGHLTLGLQDVCVDLQAMGYRVAARVVSAAKVGASHTRERVFILAHADIQGDGEPGMYCGQSGGDPVQDGSQSDRIAGRDQECGQRIDVDVGHAGGGGLDAGAVPLFPPLPGDLAEWGEALKRSSEHKPCVHGLDDGVAFGLDRSAGAGNGVVPMAGARAYVDLKDELLKER